MDGLRGTSERESSSLVRGRRRVKRIAGRLILSEFLEVELLEQAREPG